MKNKCNIYKYSNKIYKYKKQHLDIIDGLYNKEIFIDIKILIKEKYKKDKIDELVNKYNNIKIIN